MRNFEICEMCKLKKVMVRSWLDTDDKLLYKCDIDEWVFLPIKKFKKKDIPNLCPYKLEQVVMEKTK